jgi:hypothetical protein
LVYKLYGLTDDEIELIEGDVRKSEVERRGPVSGGARRCGRG